MWQAISIEPFYRGKGGSGHASARPDPEDLDEEGGENGREEAAEVLGKRAKKHVSREV